MADSTVDKGKKALEDSAFKLSKSFLTGITEQINGAVEQLNDIAKNIGAVFQRPNKGKSEKKQRVPSFDWSNEYPVIYGGYGVTINGKALILVISLWLTLIFILSRIIYLFEIHRFRLPLPFWAFLPVCPKSFQKFILTDISLMWI